MQNDWLAKRVEMLENTVNGPDGLVPRVDRLHERFDVLQGTVSGFRTEFLQFSGWAKNEFSAVRGEMAAGFTAVRQEMAEGHAILRQELGAKIEAGDRETRDFMRVLYEDLVARISLLQEGIDRRN